MTRPIVAPRPTAKPTIRVRARVVSSPTPSRARRRTDLVGRSMMLASLMGLTYVSSTLAGYVMLERTRQLSRHNEDRAAYARQEASAARESIEALTSPTALQAWADAHGFVAEGVKPAPKDASGETRVALR